MRALYYFQLLDFWGGVPLYDETTIISDDFMNMKKPNSLTKIRLVHQVHSCLYQLKNNTFLSRHLPQPEPILSLIHILRSQVEFPTFTCRRKKDHSSRRFLLILGMGALLSDVYKRQAYIPCSLSGWQESRQSLCCGLPLASSDCGNLRLISRKIPETLLSLSLIHI